MYFWGECKDHLQENTTEIKEGIQTCSKITEAEQGEAMSKTWGQNGMVNSGALN